MDEIQRKLALIDAQLSGGVLRRHLVSTAPLFFPAVGLMTGIVLQDRVLRHVSGLGFPSLSLWLWLTVLALVTGIVSVYLVRRRMDLRPEVLAYSALLGFICLGAIRLLAYEKAAPQDIRDMVGPDRVLATVHGRVLIQPYQDLQDWCFAQLTPGDPSSAFYLRLDRVKTPAGWQPAVGTIRVQVDEPVPNLKIGDCIQAYCWLHRFEEPSNPGQFNLAQYLRLRNVFVGASVPVREAIELCNDGPAGVGIRLRSLFTSTAATGAAGPSLSGDPERGHDRGVAAGRAAQHRPRNERSVPPDRPPALDQPLGHAYEHPHRARLVVLQTDRPVEAGPGCGLHGSHGGLSDRRSPAGTDPAAGVIVWAYCASILLRRRSNGINSLSLAVIVLLLFQPTQLFDAGWQLSFASVAGILAFTRRIEDFAHERTGDWFHRASRDMRPALRLLKRRAAASSRSCRSARQLGWPVPASCSTTSTTLRPWRPFGQPWPRPW